VIVCVIASSTMLISFTSGLSLWTRTWFCCSHIM